ncbi:hypothetical protein WA158_000610 [Blastocystis sp. Blastoise]
MKQLIGLISILGLISLVQSQCTPPYYQFTLRRGYALYAREESWKLFQGTDTTGILIHEGAGTSADDYTVKEYNICIQMHVVYTLAMYDSLGDGWSTGSYLWIIYHGVTFLTATFYNYDVSGSAPKLQQFYLNIVIPYDSTWKTSTIAQTGTSWTQMDFDDSSWSSLASGSFPSISTTTRYYRYIATIIDSSAYAFHINVRTNSGFIAYVNGIEASRVGLPTICDSNTDSLISETDATLKVVIIPLSEYATSSSTLVVAIEIHCHSSQFGASDVFDVYATTVYSYLGEVGTYGGTATCSADNANTNDVCKNVVDSFYNTIYYYQNTDNIITITLPHGSKTWFNAYQIASAGDYEERDPKEWTVYGSEDDGMTWIFLDHVTDNYFNSRFTQYVFNIPSNRKAFNQIKFRISRSWWEIDTQIAEICTYIIDQPIVAPGLQYPSHTLNINTNDPSVSLSPISSGIHTFTVTPELPTGLFLDSINGDIFGYVDTAITTKTYTISGIDGVTNAPTSFTMTISKTVCEQPAMAQVVITKVNKSTSKDERVVIYSEDNTQIITLTGVNNGANQVLNECQVAGRWKFVLNLIIARLYLLSGSTATYYVNTRLDLPSKSNAWKYQRGAPTDVNWKTALYSDASWQTLTYSPLVYTTQSIILLRNTFTIISKTNMVGWELFFKSKAGCVIYVNGNEVYRNNLIAGEITTSTVATRSDSSFLWRSVSGPMTTLSNGNSITIAVALVNCGIGSYYVDFDGLFHLLGDSNVIQNASEGSYYTSSNDLDSSNENLFDGDTNTRWITGLHDSITPHYATITFNNNNAELINKYCIVSNWDSPQYDPADWIVSGSLDGTTFTDLSIISNVSFKERLERRCFYMPTNNKAYSTYKWTITKAAVIQDNNRYAASEFEFYLENIESLVIPAFSFTPASIVAYKGVTVPALLVSSEYYYDFAISPALPIGVTLDSSNGYFNGIPTTLLTPTTYTISAKSLQGTPVSTTITFSVITCSYPNNLFKLRFYFTSYANEASWTLKDSTDTVIDSRFTSVDYSTQDFIYCRAAGIYTLVMSDSKNDGWGDGTYSVFVEDSTTALVSGSLAVGESPKTVTLNIGRIVSNDATWKQLNSGAEAPSGWNTVSFSDAVWPTGISGSLSAPTGTTQYYRTTFTLSTIDPAYSGIDISASTYAGMIVYLNGHEIRRINMPTGTVNYNTAATAEFTSSALFTSSVSTLVNPILVVGTNVIAVEIHKKDTLPATNEFTCFTSFIASGEYRLSDGVAWSDIEKTGDDGTDKLFDNNLDTSVVSGPRCVGAIYQYTFNNDRKEFINHYKITNGNTCNQRSPSSWRIEGSNDNGVNWTLLDHENQQFFTSYGQTFSYDFYSFRPYNSYRFIATECNNSALDSLNCSDGFQLSEFGLYITNTPSSCVSDGIWGPAVEGGYSFQECPIGYDGIQRRLCTAGVFGEIQQLCTLVAPTGLAYTGSPFIYHKNIPVSLAASVTAAASTFSVDPSLPNGLTINPSNGMISGTPTTYSDITTYTITATNTAGSVSTTIMIFIDLVFCTSEDNWPLTEIGQEASLPCEDTINYEGSRTRLCQIGYPAIWGSVINNCQLRMPTIIYTVPTTIGYKNVPITPITALITGSNLNPLTISPSLPNGLFFNSITGLIYGTPTTTTSSSSVLYTITISNPRGESTATITITIKDSSCPIDDIWPITEAGEQAILDCEDTINYEGFRTRLCIRGDPAVWGDIINNCQLLLPTISYATTNIIGNKNNAITPVAATITGGNLNPLTISPSLPDGLIFNTENGFIYGIPTSDSSNTYTITISNPTGQSTATITITISASNCISDDIWPATEAGQQITLPCEDTINYEGFRTRLCKLEYPAVWGDIINNCQLKMPSIIYDITTITGYKNIAINSVNATITGGNLNSITINPSLPDGLIFNTENGQIYGTPTSSSSGSYVITVSNPRGEDNAVINIIINIYNCIMDDIWPVTEAGEQVTLPCEDTINYEGFRTRLCLLGNPAVWEDAVNNCQLNNPSISYITTTITGYKNIGITPIMASITGGNLNPLTINPSLPDGLIFNSVTGVIYGIPTSDSSNTYAITISNSRGESTATITIIISIANCPDDTVWSATEIGQQITLPCEDPINYEGFRTRLCKLGYPAVWGTIINNCQLKMPSISYHTNEIIGYKNIAITPIMASLTGGNLNPLTINPSLPDGLSFNPTTGLIYGIPTSSSSNTYTVTISNSRGESTATITITISIISCVAENGWSMTEIGQQITLPCEDPINYEGFRTRLCKLEYPAVWGDIINNCQLKMPSISYNENTIIGYKNDIITPIMASITGGNLNPLTISPSLPDGLSFNTQNGFIYGIPTSASSNSYTITASNARGESTATITITISIIYCPSDDNWPITERGITAYIECPSGQSGIQSRVCQNTGVGTASWQVADSSECYVFIVNEDPGENKVFITVPMRLEGLTESVFNTPSTIETFRTLIVQSLASYSIPSSGVKIISVSSVSTYTDGVSVDIRITANQSDEDNIKNDINTLFTGIDSILLKLFKTSDDSNLKAITGVLINGKIVSSVFALKYIKNIKKEKKEKKLQPHKKTPEVETVKVEKPVIL